MATMATNITPAPCLLLLHSTQFSLTHHQALYLLGQNVPKLLGCVWSGGEESLQVPRYRTDPTYAQANQIEDKMRRSETRNKVLLGAAAAAAAAAESSIVCLSRYLDKIHCVLLLFLSPSIIA